MLETIYKCAKHVIPLLNQTNVNYFAIGGTLLGTMRHGGIIPWDLDMDFGIDKKSYLRILDNLAYYNSIHEDFTWIEVKVVGVKIYYKNKAYVDLFVMEEYKNTKKIAFSAPYDADMNPSFDCHTFCFPKIKINKQHIYPTKYASFEDMRVKVPNKPLSFLYANYNKYCMLELIGPNKIHSSVLHGSEFDYLHTASLMNHYCTHIYKKYPHTYYYIMANAAKQFGNAFEEYGVENDIVCRKKYKLNKLMMELPRVYKDVKKEKQLKTLLKVIKHTILKLRQR